MVVSTRSSDTAGRSAHRPVGGCLCALAVLAPLAASPAALADDEMSQAAAPASVVVNAEQRVEDVTAKPETAPPAAAQAPAEDALADQHAGEDAADAGAEPPVSEDTTDAPADPQAGEEAADAGAEPPATEDATDVGAEAAGENTADAPADPQADEEAVDAPAPTGEDTADASTDPHAGEAAADVPVASGPNPPVADKPRTTLAPAAPSPAPVPPAAPPEPGAAAVNTSSVFQVIWQVQQGCQTYCWATSQTQAAVQQASTTQTATAQAPSATALAANSSLTVQFAWQMQIGCVAFCYGTSQTQLALQQAETVQLAVALASLGVAAQNVAETIQQVWQFQQGCREECHGTSQTQVLAQAQSTSESAIALAQDGPANVLLPVLGADGLPVLPDWLLALALNVGATIQMTFQYEEAACLQHCGGDAQAQSAGQAAVTVQDAFASADDQPAALPPAEPGPPAAPPPAGGPTLPAREATDGEAPAIAAGVGQAVGEPLPRSLVHDAGRRPRSPRRVNVSGRRDGRVSLRHVVSRSAGGDGRLSLRQVVRGDARTAVRRAGRVTTRVSLRHDVRLRRTSIDMTVRSDGAAHADTRPLAARTSGETRRLGPVLLLAGALALALTGAALRRRRHGHGMRR